MIKTNDPLIPPFRFAIVEEGLLRGSYPTDRNFRFLKRFKLKTIVSLTPKPPTKSFYTFCEQNNTVGKHFTVSKFKDDVTLSASQVVQLLEMMIEPNNLPMYIHCLDGANVTGTIFMCLRKLQNWNLSSIFQEFTRFTRGGTIASSEAEFVETFKAEIDVSSQIPPWLWQGIRMIKHPTLKLRLVGGDQQPTLLALNQDSSLNLLNTPIIGSVTSGNNLISASSTSQSTTTSLPNTTNTTPNRSQLTSTIVDDGGNLLQKLIELNLNNNINNNNIQNNNNNNSNIQNDNQTIVNNNHNNNNNIQEENIEKQDKTLKTSSESESSSNIEKTTGEKKKNTDLTIENVTVTSSTTTTTTNIVQQQPTLPQSNTPNISSVLTQSPRILSTISPLSTSSIISGKDKKKKVEDIKIQFDSGKFMTLTESRSLEALSLERSSKPSLSSQSNNSSGSSNSSNQTNTTTSNSPNSHRNALFLSSNPNDK